MSLERAIERLLTLQDEVDGARELLRDERAPDGRRFAACHAPIEALNLREVLDGAHGGMMERELEVLVAILGALLAGFPRRVLRIRSRGAPYIHEAAHEVLATRGPLLPFEYADSVAQERASAAFPLWLSEGLPDVLAQMVAAETGFSEGDVFAVGGLARADSTCAARLAASARREEILEKVGGQGRLMALFTTERGDVAPVFYACSQAFAKFLTDRVGVAGMVGLFPHIPDGTWQNVLAASAGQPLAELRRRWLDRLPPSGGS